jgi:hypothetical protein
LGAQLCHHGLGAEADFLTCDVKKLQKRKSLIMTAVTCFMNLLQGTLDLDQPVHVTTVSSWMTGFDERRFSNADANFSSTPTLTQYMLQRAVKMEETDTMPTPVHKNPTTRTQGFSKDFTPAQLEQGRSRLDGFIRGMRENSFMLLDSNEILFEGTPHDIYLLLSDMYSFSPRLYIWDKEIVAFVHTKEKKVIGCFSPACLAAESRAEIPTWKCVLRCMTVEVLKRVVQNLVHQHDQESELSEFSGDAILGGYFYEYVRNALHFSGMAYVPAAFVREATTAPTDLPLRQNKLGKTISDPNYPITRQLRKEYHRSTPIDRKLNPLIIDRACTRLTFVMDASHNTQIRTAIAEADAIINEDKPSSSTFSNRWTSVLEGIDPSSELRHAIERILNSMKKNCGNPTACGKTDDEKMEYDDEFLHMTQGLSLQTPFYVRASDHQEPVPINIPDDRLVFANFTEAGLKERVWERRTTVSGPNSSRFNSSHYLSERPAKYLTCKAVLDAKGRRQYIGDDGKQSFVLVWLMEREKNIASSIEDQMQAIEKLVVGTKFWVRQNSKSSTTIAPPINTENHRVFHMPVWTSVRDRLGKKGLAPKKVRGKASGEWFLCELVVKSRRPWMQKKTKTKNKQVEEYTTSICRFPLAFSSLAFFPFISALLWWSASSSLLLRYENFPHEYGT